MSNALTIFAFIVIFWRVVLYCADMPQDFMRGNKLRALGLGISLAAIIAAAIAVLVGMEGAGNALLISIAVLIISDRRHRIAP